MTLPKLSKFNKYLSNEQGVAHLWLLGILLVGIILAVALVQTQTNILPHAQEDMNLTPQTAFHLFIEKNYQLSEPSIMTHVEEFKPSRTWFKVGEEIRVNVAVSSDIDAANTFSADISYPKDLLEVTSLIKENSGGGSTNLINASASAQTINTGTQVVGPGCKVGGCSGQLCEESSVDGKSTTCEWKDEYACYKTGRCEKQSTGQCGWTQTPELKQCLFPSQKVGCETDVDCKNGQTCQPNMMGCNSPDPNSICNANKICLDLPSPTCKPIPSCVYSNPACDIAITPEGNWCPYSPPVDNYFIKLWLPDTRFDNENGQIVLSGGVTGQGLKTTPPQKPIMATIVFKALKNGEAKLEFKDSSLILRNSDSANILTSKEGLTITIADNPPLKGDLDGDGVVGYKDFSMLLSKWGSPDKVADINGDGKVNIFDFSLLVSNWSK